MINVYEYQNNICIFVPAIKQNKKNNIMEDENEYAVGKKIDGKIIKFEVINGHLDCSYNQLTELIVPESVTTLDCSYNQLTESEKYYENPKTNRVVIKISNDDFICGCFRGTKEQLNETCIEKGFNEVIKHFEL